MANNFLYIPFINPVKFYKVDRSTPAGYYTKHFDDFLFRERLYDWQEQVDFKQIWQTTDIVNLQFESTFNPIDVQLLDSDGNVMRELPALIGLPHKTLPNTWAFEVNMSLAGLATGCYTFRILAGSGSNQEVYVSGCQLICDEVIDGSILLTYWNNRFHQDVMFESGIKFNYRLFGHIGALTPGLQAQRYKDQRLNPTTLSARTSRAFDVYFGDEYGLPDDVIDLLNRVWSCSNVQVDGKSFGVADDGKFEFITADETGIYPKRGVKLQVEEGINRNSAVFGQNVDSTKKLMYAIMIDPKVFGDTSNSGSSNTVPIITIE